MTIKRINKLKNTYNVKKIREEIIELEKQQEYAINRSKNERDDVGFIWFEDKGLDDSWELGKFQKDFKLDMAGVARMQPKTCYAFHYDYSCRIHLAVDTSEKNFFLFSDQKQYHIPMDGHAYVIDTTEEHTFINADDKLTRKHIGGHPHFLWSWDSVLNGNVVEAYN